MVAIKRKMAIRRQRIMERKNAKRSKSQARDVTDMPVQKRSRMDKREEKLIEKRLKMGTESADSELDEKTDEDNSNKGKQGPLFKDLGGMRKVMEVLKKNLLFPLEHPECLRKVGLEPVNGILLCGPPGCGKTMLAHAIANELRLPFYKAAATEFVSGISGNSEKRIRQLFEKAHRTAPSIVFIDEIDAIGVKRDDHHRALEIRIVTQLLACMDEAHKPVQAVDTDTESDTDIDTDTDTHSDTDSVSGFGSDVTAKSNRVLVIGATNRPDTLDSALRRPGRFDQEITLGVPDEKGRRDILTVLITNRRIKGSFDLLKIARSTAGFVGADLAALVNQAGNLAMMRIIDRVNLNCGPSEDWWMHPVPTEDMKNLSITMADFEEASKLVQPSSRREGFSFVPSVKWEDVGGLLELRKDFNRYIVKPIKNPEIYNYAKLDLDFGFLLYGPPGCGKTLIAKAVANESGANFIHIKGPELLDKYVGQSELAVRNVFKRARTCSPCILFFDEIDALVVNRSGRTEGGDGVVSRILKQLMIELSGSDGRRNIFVIGATNRPELMDRALFRSERFGRLVHVTLPNADERGSILEALGRGRPIDPSMDLVAFGSDEVCENYSGADLRALMNEAIVTAVEEACEVESKEAAFSFTIKKQHFQQALKKVIPSVSEEQKQHYFNFEKSLKACTQKPQKGKCPRPPECS